MCRRWYFRYSCEAFLITTNCRGSRCLRALCARDLFRIISPSSACKRRIGAIAVRHAKLAVLSDAAFFGFSIGARPGSLRAPVRRVHVPRGGCLPRVRACGKQRKPGGVSRPRSHGWDPAFGAGAHSLACTPTCVA
ncbi:hypothetical protein MTO96_043551 [Rhipicephalus appendiculatus]